MQSGTYYFLDVGSAKSSECTLIQFGDTRILIGGGHAGSLDAQPSSPSVPEQLERLLGPPPHEIALLVVTHCHAGHVGCLPELVARGLVRVRFALLADPKLGFGRTVDEEAVSPGAMQPGDILATLLREEDVSDLEDAELDGFINGAALVEGRYNDLVENLVDQGVAVSIWRGSDQLEPSLADLLRSVGASILGPSEAQLLFCAEQVATTNRAAKDAAAAAGLSDRSGIAALYRSMASRSDAFSGSARGSGMNCQSITVALGPPHARALLGGDMQFVEPGVPGIDQELAELRRKVREAGPYKLYKTTRHTGRREQHDAFLDDLGNPPFVVHSGGLRDEDPFDTSVLKSISQRRGLIFARTDHNGLVTVAPEKDGRSAFAIGKGVLNDFGARTMGNEQEGPEGQSPIAALPPDSESADPPVGPQIVIVNLPPGPIDLTVSGVEIKVRAPASPTSLKPQSPRSARLRSQPFTRIADDSLAAVASGRDISKLLFLTDSKRLAENIGRSEAEAAIEAIRAAGGELIDDAGKNLVNCAQDRLKGNANREGLVLLGGYDIVPPARRDVLGVDFRNKLGSKRVGSDNDKFWVWSDASYGDLDDDAVAELPISRIPDAREAQVFLSALRARPLTLSDRFGIHNINRPFATDVWNDVSGTRAINVCEHFSPNDIAADEITSSCHYYMLHGAEDDARYFSGETANGNGFPVAFNISSVPTSFQGFVFTGCCWGALIVREKAVNCPDGVPPPRLAQESIALSYLKAGAVAFVGCTGSHYSGPSRDHDKNFAFRLHRAFWSRIQGAGVAPARALFEAKAEYATSIVEAGQSLDPLDTARRLKNLAQFTCLGFGW
ncbi:MBL fold metallo-hydrolase [uncultured Methylobacterium sp.]|uniref:MBL fold metallo-hydrolase n=1 Tax=uncultured Methylobacterium sp. TaxID=157278 RepID=UPI002597EC02|nr:MBL fold metallo-hydrolase [uncultured Methylobacterium sp.]